ncbi:unnamed protein product [Lactuca saligna]|uniref:Uncharacterized protein n=1 Tax=Lactuca saligna TaxID=75948 RepID=A0AA35YU50_LACSI|nr:unnamed protein product [Lactuca saligna]
MLVTRRNHLFAMRKNMFRMKMSHLTLRFYNVSYLTVHFPISSRQSRYTFSPFTIRTESDDEAPVTKGQIKAIHEKLDSLLQASNPSSSDDYSQAAVKSILVTLTKEHSSNLEKMNKVVDASATIYNEMTEKVDNLVSDIILLS